MTYEYEYICAVHLMHNLDRHVWICKGGLQCRIQLSVVSRTEGNSIQKVPQKAGVDKRRVRDVNEVELEKKEKCSAKVKNVFGGGGKAMQYLQQGMLIAERVLHLQEGTACPCYVQRNSMYRQRSILHSRLHLAG